MEWSRYALCSDLCMHEFDLRSTLGETRIMECDGLRYARCKILIAIR